MENFDYTITNGSGRYSNLDKEYNKFLGETLKGVQDEKIIHKWEIYNLIINELLQLGEDDLFNEIRYRLTDNENPNDVMLDIIYRNSNLSGFLWLIRKRIEEFSNDDFENQFYE